MQGPVGTGRPSALSLAPLALLAMAPPLAAQDAARRPQREPERPLDPPGVPAVPDPNAPPALPVVLGPFASVQVNVDSNGANITGDAANEPSIAVDPTDPSRMVIGWRQFDDVSSNFRQAGYGYTTDGGKTWTFPGSLTPGTFRSDPVLDFDLAGNFYYNSLESNFTTDVFESSDGGASWSTPVYAFGGDKQWMAIDRTGGMGSGYIYSAWSIFASCCAGTFTRSTDGGATWSTPVPVTNSPVFGTMDVGPDGAVYVCGADPNTGSSFWVTRSSDAQNAGMTPSFDLSTNVDLGGTAPIFTGLPASNPNPAGLMGQANVAVDESSGPTAGNVYLMRSVDPPGSDPLDVRISRSEDGGATWSSSVRVNDDPDDTNAWQWFGTLSVAPNGRLDAVWNDTRNTGQANLSQLFYAFSFDGGDTWSKNRPVSPMFDSHVGWPNQDKLGDYYDMVSDDTGAHLAWAATFNNEQDVYYLRLEARGCLGPGGCVGPRPGTPPVAGPIETLHAPRAGARGPLGP